MKSWRLYEQGALKCDEMETQLVGAGCVKLKMLNSAVSLTDVMLYDGRLNLKCSPMTIGRQGVGMVTEVGSEVTRFVRGNRVAIDPYRYCGSCISCKAGKPGECEKLLTHGVDDDGFMSDFVVVDANNLFLLPDRVKDSDAVFLEHIAMAINTVSHLNLQKGEHFVIVGANVIGIIMAQVAMYYQAVPVLIDTRQDRLTVAEEMGIYYTVNSVDADPYKKIFNVTGGRMAEAVAYITTSKMSLARSFDYASKGGRVAIVGWADTKTDLNANMSAIFLKQLSIVGINNGAKNISSAINLLANKSVDVTKLISREIAFEDVGKMVAEQVSSPNRYMKVLVKL